MTDKMRMQKMGLALVSALTLATFLAQVSAKEAPGTAVTSLGLGGEPAPTDCHHYI